mmetsp:Transcript_39680/g.82474  ORF Transcript_39680/g.82474 Transcript_39680/m.82474 type:complete len:231 (+) Transcript_39680:1026-1718(+)
MFRHEFTKIRHDFFEFANGVGTIQPLLVNNSLRHGLNLVHVLDQFPMFLGHLIVGNFGIVFQQEGKVNLFFIVVVQMKTGNHELDNPLRKQIGFPSIGGIGRFGQGSRRDFGRGQFMTQPFMRNQKGGIGPMSGRVFDTKSFGCEFVHLGQGGRRSGFDHDIGGNRRFFLGGSGFAPTPKGLFLFLGRRCGAFLGGRGGLAGRRQGRFHGGSIGSGGGHCLVDLICGGSV